MPVHLCHWLGVIALLETAALAAETPASCTGTGVDGTGTFQFHEGTSTCLYFSTKNATWSNAQAACVALKGNLATVGTEAIYEFVKAKAQDLADANKLYWIGLYQVSPDWSSTHRWIDGSASLYRNWDVNQPNPQGLEQCVAHDAQTTRWKDLNCGREQRYICERSDRVSPPVPPVNTEGNCQEKWADFRGECYHFSGPTNKTFEEARLLCSQDLSVGKGWPRADLVSIHDSLTNDYIIGEMRRSHYRHRPAVVGGFHPDVDMFDFWIGLHDNVAQGGDNVVVWTDQTPFNYNNWHVREPEVIKEGTCFDFGAEYERIGNWAATNCHNRRGYVCKGPKKKDAPAPPTHTGLGCPDGFIWFGTNCLKVVPMPADKSGYNDAQAQCEATATGSIVATVTDVYENAQMRVMLNGLMTANGANLQKATAWLGMEGHTGNFVWHNNCPVVFTNFKNLFEKPQTGAACVHMNEEGRWLAVDCATKANFVLCEKRTESCPKIHNAADPYLYCHDDFPMECGRSCYRVVAERNTHDLSQNNNIAEARDGCAEFASRLASIRSLEDQTCIEEHIKYVTHDMWIGLRGVRHPETSDLEWKWETGVDTFFNAPTEFVNWESKATPQDGVGLCAILRKDGKWANMPCDMPTDIESGYVCEMRKQRRTVPRWTDAASDSDSGGMSGGAVAGLVIGILMAVAIVGAVLFVGITGRTQVVIAKTKSFLPGRNRGTDSGNRPLY